MSNYTRWYRDGTLSVTNGSTAVAGSGTYWKSAGLNPGDMLEVNNSGLFYEIASVNSDTSITLARAYQGSTVTGVAYAIVRNFTATMPSKIAAQTAELLRDFRKYIETDMDRITGRSAYEIAKLHGYTDTEEKWLESLKGAGEISTINTKLGRIYNNNAPAHNAVPRGKNLGTSITDAQISAIRNGSFDDLYPGDYWNLPVDGSTTALIVGCDIRCWGYSETGLARTTAHSICVWFHNDNWKYPVNDTATTEGHLKGSKMYTETLPELLEKIQAVIPDEYFNIFEDAIGDSTNSSGARLHAVAEAMKLFIPSAYNIGCVQNAPITNSAYNLVSKVFWPYCMHKPQISWYSCWLDSPANASEWYCKDNTGALIFHSNANFPRYVWPYAFLG